MVHARRGAVIVTLCIAFSDRTTAAAACTSRVWETAVGCLRRPANISEGSGGRNASRATHGGFTRRGCSNAPVTIRSGSHDKMYGKLKKKSVGWRCGGVVPIHRHPFRVNSLPRVRAWTVLGFCGRVRRSVGRTEVARGRRPGPRLSDRHRDRGREHRNRGGRLSGRERERGRRHRILDGQQRRRYRERTPCPA
jgi:hypothetical protein